VLGGNLCTLNLLQGTRWFPDLTGAVVVVEDDDQSDLHAFTRDLQSLLHQPGGDALAGVVIGRFQQRSNVGREDLEAVVDRLPQLRGVPLVANADVGHTNPFFTFPVGGEARLHATADDPRLVLTRH
jgi:muramoyltetrapeptide carboxypeptidase LdcA involved in peptidoglycan recycling